MAMTSARLALAALAGVLAPYVVEAAVKGAPEIMFGCAGGILACSWGIRELGVSIRECGR